MADDDDYQILPQKDFFALKKRVDELSGEASPKKLMETMEELKRILNELIELFKATSQEIKQEEKDDVDIKRKLDKLMSQNKVIAEAILAVSERIGMHHDQKDADLLEPVSQQPMQSSQQGMPMQQPQAMQSPQSMPGMQPYGAPSMPPMPPSQPEPFTPRPFGGFGSPEMQRQPFGMRAQPSPFEPPEFSPMSGQGMNMPPPQPGSPFAPPGPQPDFPDLGDPLGGKKKKGFFGFGK